MSKHQLHQEVWQRLIDGATLMDLYIWIGEQHHEH